MDNRKRIVCVRILEPQTPSDQDLIRLTEACFRFTPQIALRKPHILFLDITKSLSLFSETSIHSRIRILAKRLNLSVKITLSDHPCFGLAQSYFPHFEQSHDPAQLPLEALSCFLDPFNTQANQIKSLQTLLSQLRKLGIINLKELILLPAESLGSRFGQVFMLAYARLKYKIEPAWASYAPSPLIEEVVQLDDESMDGVEVTLEPLLFVLKPLIDRALIRAIGLGKRASRVSIELKLAPWSTLSNTTRTWEFSLPIPQGTSLGLLPIIRERLSFEFSQTPLLAPARQLRFVLLETVPGHGSQRDFFSRAELEAENWDQLLGRLLSQLGEDFVFHAAPIEQFCPEKSWIRTLSPKKSTSQPHNVHSSFHRPSRILKLPVPLKIQPGTLIHPNGTSWKILSWHGPERISTEWWNLKQSAEVSRDYYQVVTQHYEKLWVFFDRMDYPPQVFLHGFFD